MWHSELLCHHLALSILPLSRARSAQAKDERNIMSDEATYVPPRVWSWSGGNGGKFAHINRPTAGARQEQDLPRGAHPLQL